LGFIKKYYEKIILAVFLLVFIVSLILLILALMKSQEIKEGDLKFPMKQPDYKRINPDEFSIQKKFESENRWVKVVARTEGDKDYTDMLAPYQIARCPNPECQKLIPRSCFAQGGSCPICKTQLRGSGTGAPKPAQYDTDDDGIPDKDEKAAGLNPNDPTDAPLDKDNDGFSNLEECRAKTKINDPKSHPPFAKRLYVDSIKRNKLPMVLTKVTAHGDDKNTWSIQVEQMIDGKSRTKFYKIKSGIILNDRKYEIKDITSETVEERVGSKDTRKRNIYTVVIQEEGDQPIKAKEKEDVWENNERVKIIDAFTEKEYNVAANETFTVSDDKIGEEKYTVKSVDGSKKTVIIKKNDSVAEYELTEKLLDYKRPGTDIPVVKSPDPNVLGMPSAVPQNPDELQNRK
jgi:hypothetical protein